MLYDALSASWINWMRPLAQREFLFKNNGTHRSAIIVNALPRMMLSETKEELLLQTWQELMLRMFDTCTRLCCRFSSFGNQAVVGAASSSSIFAATSRFAYWTTRCPRRCRTCWTWWWWCCNGWCPCRSRWSGSFGRSTRAWWAILSCGIPLASIRDVCISLVLGRDWRSTWRVSSW